MAPARPLSAAARESLLKRVRERQESVGYTDYASWIEAALPDGFL